MRTVRLLGLTVALLALPLASGPVRGQGAGGAPVVVELFTSQGCSSCPPADSLLGELSMLPGVIALSLHVDYWDYIGWQDRFATAETTARQRGYARERGQRTLYTPQIILDGRFDVVGTRREEVLRALEACLDAENRVALTVADSRLDVPAGPAPEEGAVIWLMAFDEQHKTLVAGGENAGRSLDNYHVVRDIERLGEWRGQAISLPLDLQRYRDAGRAGVALILQAGGFGEILGAREVEFDD